MSEHTATSIDDVRRAVDEVSKGMEEQLGGHGVRLDVESAEQVYGVWIVPARLTGSVAMKKSWQLDDFLRQVTSKLEEVLGSRVSVSLDA